MKTTNYNAIFLIFLLIQIYLLSLSGYVWAKSFPEDHLLRTSLREPCLSNIDLHIHGGSEPLWDDINNLMEIWNEKPARNDVDILQEDTYVADNSDILIIGKRSEEETQEESDLEIPESQDPEDYFEGELFDEGESSNTIYDPLEPINRVFFMFNDKLYFWFLKPVAKGYGVIVPEVARKGVRNFFSNLAFPVRFVNCLLQAKFIRASEELGLFVVNSTAGIAGLVDYSEKLGYERREEDFGQTLGVYGMTSGIYICWPFLGPSSVRDSFGMAGDVFLDPFRYISLSTTEYIAIKGGNIINNTSLSIGDYETLKDVALDPYISFRNAYQQIQDSKIKE